MTVLPTGTKTPVRRVVVGAVGQLDQVDAPAPAPKWLSGLVSVTGGPRLGGVPVAVPRLVYWPAVAIRDAVKVQVSVGSSRPSALVSPPTKVGVEVVGRVARRAVVVGHRRRRTGRRCRCW